MGDYFIKSHSGSHLVIRKDLDGEEDVIDLFDSLRKAQNKLKNIKKRK